MPHPLLPERTTALARDNLSWICRFSRGAKTRASVPAHPKYQLPRSPLPEMPLSRREPTCLSESDLLCTNAYPPHLILKHWCSRPVISSRASEPLSQSQIPERPRFVSVHEPSTLEELGCAQGTGMECAFGKKVKGKNGEFYDVGIGPRAFCTNMWNILRDLQSFEIFLSQSAQLFLLRMSIIVVVSTYGKKSNKYITVGNLRTEYL